jgi:hypothetical protein
MSSEMRLESAVGQQGMCVNAKCTCVGCPENKTCEWAWDPYNMDGDCLGAK